MPVDKEKQKRMKKENKELARQRKAAEREKERRMNQLKKIIALIVLCAIVVIIAAAIFHKKPEEQAAGKEKTTVQETSTEEAKAAQDSAEAAAPADLVKFDPAAVKGAYDISGDDLTYAQIKVKDYGTITMALDSTAAPETVDNFISLVRDGFYDGLTFHRIMDGFMVQGGDPLGNGTGGSDKKIKGEFAENGVDNPITHVRGAVSMARAQDMDSASSQFFIVQADSDFLDGQYAGFGYVTDGMEIVDKICRDAKPVDGNGTIPADQQPVIESIRIVEE